MKDTSITLSLVLKMHPHCFYSHEQQDFKKMLNKIMNILLIKIVLWTNMLLPVVNSELDLHLDTIGSPT